jgi:hypothetical protein
MKELYRYYILPFFERVNFLVFNNRLNNLVLNFINHLNSSIETKEFQYQKLNKMEFKTNG